MKRPRRDPRRNPARDSVRVQVPGHVADAMDEMLDALSAAVEACYAASRDAVARRGHRCVVAAGTRAGYLRIDPTWRGKASHTVVAWAQDELAARLVEMGEPEVARELCDADRGAICVLTITDETVGVIELHPTGTTATGGSA